MISYKIAISQGQNSPIFQKKQPLLTHKKSTHKLVSLSSTGSSPLQKLTILDVGLHFCKCFTPGLGRFLVRQSYLERYLRERRRPPRKHVSFKAVVGGAVNV